MLTSDRSSPSGIIPLSAGVKIDQMGKQVGAAIRFREVKFAYSGHPRPLIDIPLLEIASGEKVFLYGPSGCGKSTLLSLVSGVQVPQSGSVELLGNPFSGESGATRDRMRADNIGLIFQQFNLVPYLSVRENVTLPCRFSAARAAKAKSQSGSVEAEADKLLWALRMGDLLDRAVGNLSVGEQQRTAVARALLGSPEILIADEPTSSLDADARDSFIELLLAQCADRATTVLFVSHDRALASHFERQLSLVELNQAVSI